ncbi:MAG: LysR substrate-binding domain-containing protein [Pseudomonadota bacterium]
MLSDYGFQKTIEFCYIVFSAVLSEGLPALPLTFKQIEAFRAVMLAGTTSEAARNLGVSQPAVSRLVADMEQDIGYQLFSRIGRRLTPSHEARLLVEEVNRALTGLEHIREAAVEIGRSRFPRLRLVAHPLAASGIVADLVAKFSAHQPGVAVTIEVMSSDEALEWVLAQRCDLGITSASIKSPGIDSLALEPGQSVCIVPCGHRLAQTARVSPECLEGEAFVSYCRDSEFRMHLDQIFSAANVERQLQFEARTTEAICALVAAGLGVSVVGPIQNSHPLLRPDNDKICAIPFHPAPEAFWSIIWPAQRPRSASAESFVGIARRDLDRRAD